ncbi:putative transcription factor, K-box [Helianthus anomalus]
METILERYERYSYAEKLLTAPETETKASWTLESSKLKARIELLEKNIRHYVGEELEQLNLRDLQNVEQQIETALKRIRTKKNQVMHESISELHKKERALQERNNSLSKKLKENEKNGEQQNSRLQLPQPHTVPSFGTSRYSLFSSFCTYGRVAFNQFLTFSSGPFIGAAMREEELAQTNTASTTIMPLWMIRHINQ